MTDLRNVIVVGGGTSGWLSATYLASSFKKTGRNIKVTLIESANIPTIGVGEGTFPTIVNTLYEIGLSEKDFLASCDASFKQGALFKNWLHDPQERTHGYYHPFDPPEMPKGIDLSAYWVKRKKAGTMSHDFSHATCVQAQLCDHNLAPKTTETPEFSWLAKYAYHLDAAKLGKVLQKHGTEKLNIEHIFADIEDVNIDNDGYIASITSNEGKTFLADFFVDCTGFRSLLLGKALTVPFVSQSQYLSVDSAVTLQVSYEKDDSPIATHTISTAQEAGWIWDISLQSRRGTGYVYSSKHTTPERAEAVLKAYHNIDADTDISLRHIHFDVGYREKSWYKNCCAIGFSSGFVEPLEATAIAMVEAGVRSLAARFPQHRAAMDIRQQQYNEIFVSRWKNIIDFIKLHYCLSKRKDTAFWQEHTSSKTLPASLKARLEAWKYYGITDGDLPYKYDLFTLASWQYILYGLEFLPDYVESAPLPDTLIDKAFESIQIKGSNAKKQLKNNRDLIQNYL